MDIAGSLYPTGRIGTTNYILTPENIVNDMINMLPDDFWTPDIKVLDIFSKSGRFLMAAYKKLFNSPYLADMDIAKRKHHILSEQLYGITDDFTCLMLAESALYGYAQYGKKNIRMIEDLQSIVKTTDKKLVAERLGKELGGQMEFDLVIGNPPYNNDLYLDFVTVAQHLSSKYTVMITPAKWQAKGGKKNEDFRKNVVPYMSKIVYYPDTNEIFDIALSGGVTYFWADKSLHNKKDIFVRKNGETISKRNKEFMGILDLTDDEANILNKIRSLGEITIDKCDNHKFILKMSYICIKYEGTTHTNIGVLHNIEKQGTGIYFKDSKYYIEIDPVYLTRPEEIGKWHLVTSVWLNNTIDTLKLGVNEVSTDNNVTIYSTSDKNEIESVESYFNCKLIWWLMYRMHVGGNVNLKAFEFVPDPGKFDHIFTDQELYEKYNLTAEEINIIEKSVNEQR